MRYLLFLFIATLTFAQVDSMRVTWTDPINADLDSVRIYADTSAGATTYRYSVNEGIEFKEWIPPYVGHWHVRMKAVDDSSNVSTSYSNEDTVTIWCDTIPAQFTFHDSTGAVVSSQIISLPVIPTGFGCDPQVSVTGGDYRTSVNEAWTRVPGVISFGDTLWAVDTSSSSGLTKTDVIVTIAGVKDTFSVTTVATDTLGSNLTTNWNFEAAFNEETDWGAAFGGTVTRSTEQVYAGTYSAKVVTAGAGTGMAHATVIPVVQDSTYWVQGYYYLVSGAAVFRVVSGGTDTYADTYDAWTPFAFSFTATSTTNVYIRFVEYGAGGNTTFYIDNVTVKKRL